MQIYSYDRETGLLVEAREARALPGREDWQDSDLAKWQIPAHATTVAPPAAGARQCARWVGDGWEIVPDHRGETWWVARGVPRLIERIGDPAAFDPPLLAAEPPPPPLTEADYGAAVQSHIEQTAKARGYVDAVTCASYSASTVPQWRSDSAAFIAWRDDVWTYVFAQLAAVRSGGRPVPSLADFIAELPGMNWPEP